MNRAMVDQRGSAGVLGPMQLFATIRFLMFASARAMRRAGRGHSADCLPSLREGSLRCSPCWPVAELTSLAALSAFRQAATSQSTKRAARAARNPPLLGGANSPRPGPARRLAVTRVGFRFFTHRHWSRNEAPGQGLARM